jgi:hypothetical protein
LPLSLDDLHISDSCVAEEITLHASLDLKPTPCPVNPDNSWAWTSAARAKAAEAPVAVSLEDLKSKVRFYIPDIIMLIGFKLDAMHVDGKKVQDGYICIPPEICDG